MASHSIAEFSVKITSTKTEHPPNGKAYTNYLITVEETNKGSKWHLTQRYSDLNEFHHALKRQFSDLPGFPRFPGKKFTNQLDPAFIEQRRNALESYLRAVLFMQPIANSKEVRKWLTDNEGARSASALNIDDIDLSELGRTLALVEEPAALLGGAAVGIHDLVAKGHEAQMKQLLKQQPSLLERRDEAGQTPLMTAVLHRQRKVAEELVLMGADLNAADQRGMTPLLLAAQVFDAHLLALIANNASNVRVKDLIYDNTVLHLLATQPDTSEPSFERLFHLLISKGANVNAANSVGNTPLHYAAQTGNMVMMSLLIAAGAGIDNANEDNESSLHFAARAGKQRAVSFLVQAGADTNLKGKEGTPLELVYNKRARMSAPV